MLKAMGALPEFMDAGLIAIRIIGRHAAVLISKYKFRLLGLLIVFVMIVIFAGKTFAEDQGQLVYRVCNTAIIFNKPASS